MTGKRSIGRKKTEPRYKKNSLDTKSCFCCDKTGSEKLFQVDKPCKNCNRLKVGENAFITKISEVAEESFRTEEQVLLQGFDSCAESEIRSMDEKTNLLEETEEYNLIRQEQKEKL